MRENATFVVIIIVPMNHFDKIDVRVFDKFIEKFAARYIEQRTEMSSGVSDDILTQANSFGCDFNINNLLDIIKRNSVAKDFDRESGKKPDVLRDIYRSDLGELLTTYYFEEKVDEGRRFLIPLKNITYRERADMPGRGIDAIGYRRIDATKTNILIGEAKVSTQKKNPPSVVDVNEDSIYQTHKKYHDDEMAVIQRLSDYLRRLSSSSIHFIAIAGVVLNMAKGDSDKYEITYGCGLVRDFSCVDESKDFGKMKTLAHEFEPGVIDFVIFSLTEKSIDETVEMFYQKVKELVR